MSKPQISQQLGATAPSVAKLWRERCLLAELLHELGRVRAQAIQPVAQHALQRGCGILQQLQAIDARFGRRGGRDIAAQITRGRRQRRVHARKASPSLLRLGSSSLRSSVTTSTLIARAVRGQEDRLRATCSSSTAAAVASGHAAPASGVRTSVGGGRVRAELDGDLHPPRLDDGFLRLPKGRPGPVGLLSWLTSMWNMRRMSDSSAVHLGAGPGLDGDS